MKMNKIAKVVLGVLTGVVIAMGIKVEAKADVAYVFENGVMRMVSVEEANSQSGIMAYDPMNMYEEYFNNVQAFVLPTFEMPTFEVPAFNPYMPAFDMSMVMWNMGMPGYNMTPQLTMMDPSSYDWSQMFGAGGGGFLQLGYDADGQLTFTESIFPWVAPEDTFAFFGEAHMLPFFLKNGFIF